MSRCTIEITAMDPLVSRDGRPFGVNQGNRMRGLPWLSPSVVAGSFRTALVKSNPSLQFSDDVVQKIRSVEAAGAFPSDGRQLYMPAPLDCLWDGKTVHAVRPTSLNPGEGCDFPLAGLQPVMLTPQQSKEDFKPKAPPAWWPMSRTADWLRGDVDGFQFNEEFLCSPAAVVRDHVQLDADRGAAEEGKLFTSASLHLSHLERHFPQERDVETRTFAERFQDINLAARVGDQGAPFDLHRFEVWHPLGGERRLAHWKRTDDESIWKCPVDLAKDLASASCVRLTLATPAIFQQGWLPGWIDAQSLTGAPPESNVLLRLVGVCLHRWTAVSGWSLAPPIGPKPIRRMAPAGSVYFFGVEGGEARMLAQRWLQSVCDDEQDRLDGFGLALWGIWRPIA